MDMITDPDSPTIALQASLDDSRRRFLAAVHEMRPALHRFCTRMCGSVLDGEDIVQETLAQAFYYLPSLRQPDRLESWLFRIAHHKCVDFLRRTRRERADTVPYEDEHAPIVGDADDSADDEPVSEALAAMVGMLPPKERACVLLKDVLGYSLVEVAAMVETTLGGAKSAVHRGRAKLRVLHAMPSRAELDAEQRRLLLAYVECFNARDWDGLRRLIRADATLELVGVTSEPLAGFSGTYFGNYAALAWKWKLSLALVDDEPHLVIWRREGPEWRPQSAVRLWWEDGLVTRIRDYVHVSYLLGYARTVAIDAIE